MEVFDDFWMYVDEAFQDDTTVTRACADSYVASNRSVYMDEEKTCVSCPDWHHASWLTADELEQVTKQFGYIAFDMMVFVIRRFQELGYESRVVFWFDN